ncbi:MAG: ABC transporter permease subunit [Ruminococcus sp.]|nr:ABC transporter permease subunit [Ruminococcus sp.]MDD5889606.1 ABC transporter permease subunit [Ruminococcus sp.]
MNKILVFEMRKAFHSKRFFLWTILSIALSCLYLLLTCVMYVANTGELQNAFAENGVISIMRFFSKSPVCFCIAMFICDFICDDFSSGILKNVFSKGYTRKTVFTGKLISSGIIAVVMSVLSSVAVFLLSTALFGDMGTIEPINILQYIILTLGIVAFANLFTMLCALFKKSAPAVATSILALILLPIGISMAESNLHLDKLPFDISYIWLGSAIERLAVGTPSTGVMIPCTISILAYIVVIYFITMASVKKIEV